MRRRVPAALAGLLTLLLTVTVAAAVPPATADPGPAATRAAPMPSQRQWEADVWDVMGGSLAYLRQRARQARQSGVPVRRLALNLDIDNTSLASYYDRGAAVPAVLRFAREADRLGMQVFFNSHRPRSSWRTTRRALGRVGYPVDRLCLARRGERVVHSKRRCRASFTGAGYRLVANVGNRSTDFVGGGYDRAYKLPDYGGRLG
jgi:hypothetical protein